MKTIVNDDEEKTVIEMDDDDGEWITIIRKWMRKTETQTK